LPGPYDGDDIFKVTGLKSRSAGDGHRNLVNSISPTVLNGLEPKLTEILPKVGPQTDQDFKVVGSKGQGHRNVYQRRHADPQFAVVVSSIY